MFFFMTMSFIINDIVKKEQVEFFFHLSFTWTTFKQSCLDFRFEHLQILMIQFCIFFNPGGPEIVFF